MGGYGGASGRKKENCYYDTGNHKVTDKNAIEVGKYFINHGQYVAFLQEKPPAKRPDLSVNHEFLVEVKGMTSLKPNKVTNNIREAFIQIAAEQSKYPPENKFPGRVVILSRYKNFEDGYSVVRTGYADAVRRGYVNGEVYFLHDGTMYKL